MATDETGCVTVNSSRATVVQSLVNEKQPPLTSTHVRQVSDEDVPPKYEQVASLYKPWIMPSDTVWEIYVQKVTDRDLQTRM